MTSTTTFLHCFDYHHFYYAHFQNYYAEQSIHSEMRRAFRLAYLLSDYVTVAASVYYENPLSRLVFDAHAAICEPGTVVLLAKDPSLVDHLERKRADHYDKDSPGALRRAYTRPQRTTVPYRSARVLTSDRIKEEWYKVLNTGNLSKWLAGNSSSGTIPSDIEKIWERVPEIIGGRAFVAPHALQALSKLGLKNIPIERLHELTDRGFTVSHVVERDVRIIKNLSFLRTPWDVTISKNDLNYLYALKQFRALGLLELLDQDDPELLVKIKDRMLLSVLIDSHRGALRTDLDETSADLSFVKKELKAERVGHLNTKLRVQSPVVGVVTALPEEWLAIVRCLMAKEIDSTPNDPNKYAQAVMNRQSPHPVKVVITLMPRTGTNSAAVVSTNMLRSFPDVDTIIFSGIACGCPDTHRSDESIRLGDILVSDRQGLVQFDHKAVKLGSDTNRSVMPPPSRKLLDAVRKLQAGEIEGRRPWERILVKLLKKVPAFARPPATLDILLDSEAKTVPGPQEQLWISGKPRVFSGVIGSGNILLRDSDYRDEVRRKHGMVGFEMEGAGTAEAVWHFGKQYLIVRGVSDYGDDRTKTDDWHRYAAAVAAAYTTCILAEVSRP